MTRFTRGGKPTHQRVADESTPWTQLKNTPTKEETQKSHSVNKMHPKTLQKSFKKLDRNTNNKFKGKTQIQGPKRRFNREEEVSANFVELGPKNGSSNPNVKGTGSSKLVKIFGHFWVPEEDARRLQNLGKKLRGEGLSRKDVMTKLQDERRRAEKRGKKIRDKVCYGCRTFGHVLADCPESLKTGAGAAGDETGGLGPDLVDSSNAPEICFKCGSTEHNSRRCKRKGETYDFAKCFICSQTGHISRQCPQNKRGIYPGGGACNICDSTEHLAKDCPNLPQNQIAQEKRSLKRGIEDDDEAGLPVVMKISNPFASTEYEPQAYVEENVNVNESKTKAPTPKPPGKKRKVKF